jgi:hypothetical protein
MDRLHSSSYRRLLLLNLHLSAAGVGPFTEAEMRGLISDLSTA